MFADASGFTALARRMGADKDGVKSNVDVDEEEGRGWSSSLAFAKKWVTGVEKAADKPWRELLPETLQPFAPLVARVVDGSHRSSTTSQGSNDRRGSGDRRQRADSRGSG